MNNARILVADDEPMNLEIIGELLNAPHYTLDLMPDAESALARLNAEQGTYDLIILDRMMPGMNGLDMLKQLKATPRFKHIPVIMQTAASAPDQVREGIEAGAYYYLTKPYDPKALQVIVNAILEDTERQNSLSGTLELTQRQLETLRLLTEAEFHFSRMEEIESLSSLLASLCPTPVTVVFGLNELLMNAIEHGNLGISYEEKTQLKRNDRWAEEIARRVTLPEYRERQASIRMHRDDRNGEIRFTIRDQGSGFDWRTYLDIDPARAFDPNGRGIAMARQISFDRLEYQGSGNVVVACVAIRKTGSNPSN